MYLVFSSAINPWVHISQVWVCCGN